MTCSELQESVAAGPAAPRALHCDTCRQDVTGEGGSALPGSPVPALCKVPHFAKCGTLQSAGTEPPAVPGRHAGAAGVVHAVRAGTGEGPRPADQEFPVGPAHQVTGSDRIP
nr:hypothetical protein KPHV_13480 [Kitasatospora purpeofusca]